MASHDEVVTFLSAADVVGPGLPRIYQTHIALVFVAGGRAIKIKRPVNFAYLDFSTLQARHQACLNEICVNRDNAPEIYRGVVAIAEAADGALSIGGPGAPVEWAVEMAAFDDSDLLSQRAAQGPLDAALMRQTADAIHAMHVRSVPMCDVDAPGKMAAIIEEVGTICEQHANIFPPDEVSAFVQAANDANAIAREVLQSRVRSGFYRRCHGDLHLANVVIWNGKPTLFDALEFSDEFGTVDTLYDLAFLLMDLVHHRQRSAANTVLNRYLWRSGGIRGTTDDIEALALMPLYIACRAGIRAMVGASRIATAHIKGDERLAMLNDARRYLAEAKSALTHQSPRLIAIGGLSGSGKSTLAARLAPLVGGTLGALHIRSDLERKAMMGVEETERLVREHYSRDQSRLVYDRVLKRAAAGLDAGQCVIVDAVFATPEERERAADIARTRGCPFNGIWLEAEPEALRRRVADRRNDASDATIDVVEMQLDYTLGLLDWTRINAGRTAEQTLAEAMKILNQCAGGD